MSNPYSLRRVLTVLAFLALPAATCGVAPALQNLIQRTQRLERLVENAQLPPVLMDDHGIVIGRVLEYNDVMLYTSVAGWPTSPRPGRTTNWGEPQVASATFLFDVPGKPPIAMEANRDELWLPVRNGLEGFYYESSDCTGTAWISPWWTPDGASLFSRALIAEPGRTLYAADFEAARTVTARSYSTRGIAYTLGELTGCGKIGQTALMVPFVRVYDLDAFTPPFQIADQRALWLR